MDTTRVYMIILISYFAGLFIIGVISSRKSSGTSKDFFLARDRLSAPVLGFSFSATQMSGSAYMGAVGTRRVVGIPNVPAAVGSAAVPWFSYVLAGDRIRQLVARIECLTLADIFDKRYGRIAGFISTVLILVCSIPLITGQFQASGGTFETIMGIPYLTSLVVFGGIVVVYTIMGGMFAVAWTDLLQGVLMIMGYLILTPTVLSRVGGFTKMFNAYAEFNPQGISFGNAKQAVIWMISGFFLMGFFQIGGAPAAVTRFLTTTDDRRLKHALAYSVVFQSIIFFCTTILAFGSIGVIPELTKTDMLIPELALGLLPPILGGIVISAALGAMMSTVDSVVLMCSSLFVVNILGKGFNIKEDSRTALVWSRAIVLIVGVAGFLMAINPPDSIFWIITTGLSIQAAAFTFPLLAGLWWPRCSDLGGTVGMVGGALVAVWWYVMSFRQFGNLNTFVGGWWPAIVGSLVSLFLVIVVSLLTPPSSDETLEAFYS